MKKLDEEFEKYLTSLNKEELCSVLREIITVYRERAYSLVDEPEKEGIAYGLCLAESYIYSILDIPSDICNDYFDNYWNENKKGDRKEK